MWMRKDALLSRTKTKVLSWVHGGTFNFGGVDAIFESPAPLVSEQEGFMVVKMNYRLGPFGNWYFPLNVGGQPKGSWGIQDQRMGLKWIHQNIAAFNGDSDDITLGGDSSGGMGAMIHLTSAESHPYFHNAMAISPTVGIPFWNATEATMAYGYITTEVLKCRVSYFQLVTYA